MSRLSIPLPDPVLFQTLLTVRVGDLNYGRHLSNDAVLRMMHEGRIRWLASLSLSEFDIGGGGGLIMLDAAVQYRAQAFHGDEILLATGADDIRPGSFCFTAGLQRAGDGQIIAAARCHMACFDYGRGKAVRLPQSFVGHLQPARTAFI
ncbi:MAG: thioesterase family protein [Neisseria sp.]|nr:thioesterase family protein [Neisseria sp.]